MNIKDIYLKDNLVLQQGTYTCGPCSLLNILLQKGITTYNEQELSKLCGAKPGIGSSNESLAKTAVHLGLEIVDQRRDATVSDIERNIDDGAFVIVNYRDAFSGNGHYAVVTQYDDEALYLRDSSLGLLCLTKDNFKKFWRNSDGTINGWYLAVK
jgi:predicted double-glycine peptidase